MTKKTVVILTADAGFGHRSAANAIAAALKDLHPADCQVEIINPLDDERTPFFLKDSQSDYDAVIHHVPELFKLGYDVSDGILTSAIVESWLTVMLFETMRDIVRKYEPAAIVSTYPLYHAPLEGLNTLTGRNIPTITTITDLVTIHRLWFNASVQACLVPTELAYDLALANNIPEERVKITGIPVHPRFLQEKRGKNEIRAELGWQPDLPTFLAVGSRRVGRMLDTLKVLNHIGYPIQIIAIAGKDRNLYEQLQQIEWHVPTRVYEFVDNMPACMHAADVLICKAGGLIVTEGLAAGLPMLLIDVLPGQEVGNADYVVDNAAGDLTPDPLQVLEATAHLLMNDRALLNRRHKRALEIGRPNSAYDVASVVWDIANRTEKPTSSVSQFDAKARTLIDLLNKHKIRWQENIFPPTRK